MNKDNQSISRVLSIKEGWTVKLPACAPVELNEPYLQALDLASRAAEVWQLLKDKSSGSPQRELHKLVDLWGRIVELQALVLTLQDYESKQSNLSEVELKAKIAVIVDGALLLAGQIMRNHLGQLTPERVLDFRERVEKLTNLSSQRERSKMILSGALSL